MNIHERNQFAENLISEASELLADEAVQRSTPSSAQFRLTLDRLFVPNIRNDRIQLPDSYLDQEVYPIVPYEPGEAIVYPILAPSHQQLQNMYEVYRGMEPLEPLTAEDVTYDTVDDMLASTDNEVPSSPVIADTARRAHAVAWEENQFANYDGEHLIVLGRPGVIFNVQLTGGLSSLDLLHETVHIEQIVRDTLLPASAYNNMGVFLARMELEAYQRHAHVALGALQSLSFRQRASQDLGVSAAALVERAIFYHSSPWAPFKPTPELVQYLDEQDHLRLITKPNLEASLRSIIE
jgi:hypothetical protein